MSSMFLGPSGPDCSSHMNFIKRVFPHPVSPMMITGMPHLNSKKTKFLFSSVSLNLEKQNRKGEELEEEREDGNLTGIAYELPEFFLHYR